MGAEKEIFKDQFVIQEKDTKMIKFLFFKNVNSKAAEKAAERPAVTAVNMKFN